MAMRVPALFLIGGLVAGCSGEFPGVDASSTGDDDDDTGDGGNTDVAPSVLPFAVDDWYGPSGYMGDGENSGAIADDMTCLDDRPSDWMGRCHRYTWTPSGLAWAGVYWQYPDGNWGDLPGLPIPEGATSIKFRAWGATGTEKVDFMVGMEAVDGFQVTQEQLSLTTSPQQFTLSLGTSTYGKVVGGFGWVAKEATAPMTFHIDDIRWE
jgi:hypothetical protein